MDTQTIRTMYDRFSSIPGFWELDAWTCRATARSPYRVSVIEQLGLTSRSRVLDVACGTGLNFDLLQDALGGKGAIVGIDNSRKTIALARKKVDRRRWTNVELLETDARSYDPDGSFDAALCTFAIDIIPPWRETLEMMARAVRPGGRIGLIGFKESSKWGYAAFNRLWRAMSAPFGGVELGRPVREHIKKHGDEVFFKEVYGGFYYLLVTELKS